MVQNLCMGLGKRYLNYERIKYETIDKGKPFQNGFIESFFDKLRDERLNRHVFTNLAEAKEVISNYINNYNKERIHSSLNYRTPEEFLKRMFICIINCNLIMVSFKGTGQEWYYEYEQR